MRGERIQLVIRTHHDFFQLHFHCVCNRFLGLTQRRIEASHIVFISTHKNKTRFITWYVTSILWGQRKQAMPSPSTSVHKTSSTRQIMIINYYHNLIVWWLYSPPQSLLRMSCNQLQSQFSQKKPVSMKILEKSNKAAHRD